MPEFSVLLPVYIGDDPAFFERSLQSVGADQTFCPTEIMVVCDGPVKEEISTVLDQCAAGKRPDLHGTAHVTVLRLEQNQGLTAALNEGLAQAQHDIIARADADDITMPERFAIQIPLMNDYDLVGAAITEFTDDENVTGLTRYMPEEADEIRRVMTYRDPFNHPTVVYRRDAVLQVGGYEHVNYMEDYWLFARMVHAGVRCMNVCEPLVKYRIGAGAYRRRGGWTLFRSELALQHKLLDAGITHHGHYVRNIVVRGGYRLIPPTLRKLLYHTVGRMIWFGTRTSSRKE